MTRQLIRQLIRPMTRAGAWPAAAGLSGVALVVGGCGVAFPAAGTALLALAFTLLAAAAAFVLDEPAAAVVDVTPTRPWQRTGIRALVLLAPTAAGAALILGAAHRGLGLSWAATALALGGHVVLGFSVASLARTRTGEPGAPAAAAVALTLLAPSLVPALARRVNTFPVPGDSGLPSTTLWCVVLTLCLAAVAVSIRDRPLPRRLRLP